MTLEEIKAAVEAGKTVRWNNPGYRVIKDTCGQWLILCESNKDCIGLTWQDGVTVNGAPEDFYVEDNMIYTIYATWKMQGKFQVEADSLEDAKEKAYDTPLVEATMQDYIDDSFELDKDTTGDGHPFPRRRLPNRRTRTID